MSVNPNTYALSESHRQTILVVDDDPANLGVVSDFLKDFDFRILVARDGESALRKAQRGQPDLILLDVMMPGIDGFETCRRLKANEDLRDIPVLFMTALTDVVDKVKGFQAGGMDYITKPFQVEEVAARVQTHLALHAMHEQLTAQNVQLRQEVAERKQAEEALSESEARYHRLFEQTQATLAETQALYRVSRSVIALESLAEMLQTAVDAVAEALPANRVTLITFDLEAQQVIHFVKGGPGADQVIRVLFDELWNGLSGWVLRELRPALSPKSTPDPRESLEVQRRRAETNCGDIIVVPLRYQDKTLGTMTAINLPNEREFTEHDVELMVAMASQAAMAIENARLYEELQLARAGLERRVEERTAELVQANARLTEEIAERKQAEEALRRSNRELRAISNCNQTLLRAVDEQTLLNDICRIVCDEAGYRMAWVGYAENDDAKTVRPAAWAGNEAGVLANANLTWADTERGRTPTGTAIRSGESACIQDFTTDPQAAPWRETALQRGYRSSIAMPLKDESAKTFGVLNIYSTEPNAFTSGEIRLLEELAGDLAFGIVVLRTRAERKRAEETLRQSEELLRVTLTNILDPVFITDNDGKLTFICPNVLNTLGYSVEEIQALGNISKLVGDDLFNPEELEMQGEIFNIEKLIVDNLGRQRVFLTTVKRVSIGEGTRLYALHDITERKRVEAALGESEERYKSLFENSPISLWEEDFSSVKAYFDDLRASGVTNFRAYFESHPEAVAHCAALIKVLDVNQATLTLLKARDKQTLLAGLPLVLSDTKLKAFREEMITMAEGGQEFESDDEVHRTLAGDQRLVTVHTSVVPGYEHSLGKVLVSLVDITERKHAEEALKESEERWHRLVEYLPAGAVVHSGGKIVYANKTCLQIAGATREEEVVGKSLMDFVHPDFREVVIQRVKDMLELGQFGPPLEEVFLRVDGQPVCVEVTAIPQTYMGKPAVQTVFWDISKRKQAENALRESEGRYRTLFDDSPISLWEEDFSQVKKHFDELRASGITDLRTYFENHPEAVRYCAGLVKILDVNKATLALVGISTKDELLTPLSPVLAEDSLPVFREELIVLAEGGQHFESEMIHRTTAGEIRFVIPHISVAPGYENSLGKVLISIPDFTERKRAEEALRESEARLRTLIDNLPIEFWAMDHTLRFTMQNMLSLENLEPVVGKRIEDLNVPEALKALWVTEDLQVLEGKTLRKEYETDRGGIKKAYENIMAPVRVGESVVGLVGVAIDVTARRQAEEEIRKLNQELEQRVADRTAQLEAVNKELEAFAYSVSHDLRAPLRHIDGFLELLQKRTITIADEKSQHYITTISESARRMGVLIDDLLSFSRMGRSEMSRSQVHLDELVQDVIREFRPDTEGRDIQWEIAHLPLVTGDRAMLRIVLANLISNALKFTRSRSPAKIEIGWMPGRETEVTFFVRDNGVGFDMQYADKLFGVFQRLHRADEFEGTGIGLANVRRIIARHGGKTWAEGEVGQGATLYFSLPQPDQKGDMK